MTRHHALIASRTVRAVAGRLQRSAMRICLFALALACIAPHPLVQAQQYPLVVTMVVDPPYSPYLDDWRAHPERIHLLVQNTDAQRSYVFRLSGSLTTLDNSISIVTKDDAPALQLTIAPGGVVTLDGTKYALFDQNMVTATGVDRNAIARSGRLPEGTCTICVRALDYTTRAPLSAASPMGCTTVPIQYAEAPRIISPTCGMQVPPALSQPLLLQWTPCLVGVPPTELASVRYELTIVPVQAGRTPETAIATPGEPPFFIKRDLLIGQYVYTAADPVLDTGKTYAWQVRAYHTGDRVVFRDGGKSPVCSFRIATTSAFCFSLTPYEPTSEAFVAWSNTPGFKLRTTQRLDPAGVTGGLFRIWKLLNRSENLATAMTRTPTLTRDFTGNAASMIVIDSLEEGGSLVRLPCVYARDSTTFEAEDGAWYVWSFLLRHRTSILKSGVQCIRTETQSGTATFGYEACFVMEPQQPVGEKSFRLDTIPKFSITAKPRIRPAALSRTVLDIFEVSAENTAPAAGAAPVASFSNGLTNLVGSYSGLSWPDTARPDSVLNVLVVNHPEIVKSDSTMWRPKKNQWYAWRVTVYMLPSRTLLVDSTACSLVTNKSSFGYCVFASTDTISGSVCLRITPRTPADKAKLQDSARRPSFSVKVEPGIVQTAIRGGTFSIWEVSSMYEDTAQVLRRPPKCTRTFTGADTLKIKVLPGVADSSTVDLLFATARSTGVRDALDSALAQKKSYMWRFTLTYDTARIRRDSVRCHVGSVTTAMSAFTIDTTKALSDCLDLCSVRPPTLQTPTQRAFKTGDSLKVGAFTLSLLTVTGGGSNLGGTGTIPVKFLGNVRIAVEFSGLKVNDSSQVYEGELTAQQIEDAGISKELANGLGSALNLSNNQVSTIYNAATNVTRMLSYFAGTPAKMPFGWDNEIMGRKTTLAIMGMVFRPTAAYMNVVASVAMPELGQNIAIGLGARRVCFNTTTLGGDGIRQLYLPADLGFMPDSGSWGFKFLAPSSSDSGCYITFDCHGFRDARLSLQVEFPRAWLLPFPTDDGRARVKASFSAAFSRGWNWLAAASLDRCEFTDLRGFVLEVQSMTFDQSVVENPAGMQFPPGYRGDNTNGWTGFYIKRASVSLPSALRTFTSDRPPQIAVQDLIISKAGICGTFRAENVFQYPSGNLGGWGGSLDTISVSVLNSSLQSGSLMGRVHFPLVTSALGYSATISRPLPADTSKKLRYAFVVRPDSIMDINIYQGRISLFRNTSITIGNDNPQAQWRAVATLNGSLGIQKTIGGIPDVSLPGITFSNWKVQTIKPYFTAGTFGFASPQKGIAGFPVSITNIGFVEQSGGTTGDLSGLSFTLNVNFTNGTGGVGGGATLVIWGKLQNPTNNPSFEYHSITLSTITVHADIGVVKFDGTFSLFRNDAVYGTGFRGTVNAEVIKLFRLSMTAQYGRVDTTIAGTVTRYKYFYFDANILFPAGIALGTSPVGFYGFGGGFWINMDRSTPLGTGRIDPGKMVEQFRFTPKYNSYGLRAQITLGTYPNSAAFNADLAVEVGLIRDANDNVSISRITLQGNGYGMADVTQRANAKVRMFCDITYTFTTNVMHGVFAVAITAPPVQGGGQAVFHVGSPWYFKIGEPLTPFRLTIASWLPQVSAYVMMGQNLPGPAPLPTTITNVLGLPPQTRSTDLSNGKGVAFGVLLAWNTGRKTFGPFYAVLDVYGGFDIMLMKQTKCTGVNGWQAQGRLYGYVYGAVGLYVDISFCLGYPCFKKWKLRWCTCCCTGYKGYFDILAVSAAMLLEMGAPNPIWVNGTVHGGYSILGGLVKGTCNFKFSSGTECRL